MLPLEEAAVAFLDDWLRRRDWPTGFDGTAALLANFGSALTLWRPEMGEAVKAYITANIFPGIPTDQGAHEAATAAAVETILKETPHVERSGETHAAGGYSGRC